MEALEPVLPGQPSRTTKAAGQKQAKYSQSDLPDGCLKRWKELLVPAWSDYIGTRENVWDTSDDDIRLELAGIWKLVFLQVPVKIVVREAIYTVVRRLPTPSSLFIDI